MRLNKTMKDIIIKRILDDVPCVDYGEDYRKLVQAHYRQKLPPEIRKALDNPKLSDHIKKSEIYQSEFGYVYVDGNFSRTLSADLFHQVGELAEKKRIQEGSRRALQVKLEAAFAGITTRKQAAEVFPEFEKYLPAESVTLRNLPVTTDVMPALIDAGWPKGGKPPKGKAA